MSEATFDLEQGGAITVTPAAGIMGDKPVSAYITFPSQDGSGQVVSLTVGEVALLILKLRDCQAQAKRANDERNRPNDD